MHQRLLIIIISFLLSLNLCFAQTTITGTISGGEEKVISLYLIDDYITNTKLLIDESDINADGSFSLSSHFDEVRYAVIKAGFYSAGIYLEPGKHYQLECEYEPVGEFLNPNLMETPLYYTIRNEVFEGLNGNISAFNNMYDDFVMQHYTTLFRTRNGKLVNGFIADVEKQFTGYENEYFRRYVDYRIAGLKLQTRTESRGELAKEYLSGRPLYKHDEAMAFFNLYFDKYVVAQSKALDREDLQSTINYQVSYPALLDTLGKDTILRNEAMRELVMLTTLQSLIGSEDYGFKQVMHIIRYINTNSKFPEHRRIAANIMERSFNLAKGSTAPVVEINGEVFLEPGEKHILLCFFQSWNGACQAENELLKTMYPDFEDEIDIIMVCVDAKESTWEEWKATNDREIWNSLWYGNDNTLLDAYKVKAYPLYVLINPDLTLQQWDLPRPSEGMPQHLERILKK